MKPLPHTQKVLTSICGILLLLPSCGESEKDKILRELNERQEAYKKQGEQEAQRIREEREAQEAAAAKLRIAQEAFAKKAAEEKAKLEMEEKARVEAEELAAKKAMEAEEARKKQELATKLGKATERAGAALSDFSLSPKIEFSPSLGTGGSFELRGALLTKFQKLLAAKDWLGLLKEAGGTSFDSDTGLPSDTSFDYGVQRLKGLDFPLVIKPPLGAVSGKLSMVSLETFEAVEVSEPHPDGGAFVVKWSPLMGDCIVIKGRIPAAPNQLWGSAWASELENEESRLAKKKELGELDEAGVKSGIAAKRSEIRSRIQKWAGLTGGSDNNLLQSAAEAFVAKDWNRVAQLTAQAANQPGADSNTKRAAALMAEVVKDIAEMRRIPAMIKAADDEYARLNLAASRPQSDAQREAITKRAIEVRDAAGGLPMKKSELELKATKALREVEQLLHSLVTF